MAEGYLKGGNRALIDITTGKVVSINPAVADRYLEEGDGIGGLYAPITQDELNARIEKEKANTFSGKVKTFASDAVEGAFHLIQAGARAGLGSNGMLGASGLTASELDAQLAQQEQAKQEVINNNALPLFSGEIAKAKAIDEGKSEIEAEKIRQEAINQKEHEQQVLREVNPLSSTAGQMLGESLPFLLAPVGSIGARATAQILGGTETALGRFALNKVGKYAIEGAIEGGLQNVVSTAADPDSEAEDILASFGMGAALGGGLGATFGVASKAADVFGGSFGKLSKAESELLDATNAEKSWLSQKAENVSDLLADKQSIKDFDNFYELNNKINDVALDLQPKLTNAAKAIEEVKAIVRENSSKKNAIRELMPDIINDEVRIAQAKNITSDAWAEMSDDFFEPLIKNERIKSAAKSRLETFGREIDNTYTRLEKATDLSDVHNAADIFAKTSHDEINNLKSWLQKAEENGAVDTIESELIKNQISKAQKIQEKIKLSLEDNFLYGERAASAQKSVNALLNDGSIEASNKFKKEFFNANEVNAAKLSKLMKSLGKAEGDSAEKTLTEYLAKEGPILDEISKHYTLDADSIEKIAQAKATLNDVASSFSAIREAKASADRYAQVAASESAFAPIIDNLPTGGAVVGGSIAGGAGSSLGGSIGTALSFVSKKSARIRAAKAITELSSSFSDNSLSSFGNWIASGAKKVKNATSFISNAAKSTERKRSITSRAAVAVFLGDNKNTNEAMETRKRQVAELDPMQTADDLYNRGVPLNTAIAAGETVAKGKEFLNSVTPKYRKIGGLRPGVVIPPTLLEKQRYIDAYSAISDPSSVIADVMNGSASPTQVQALQKVYPKVYENIKRTAIKALERADLNGIRIPLHTIDNIALVLGLQENGSFSDSTSNAIVSALSQQNQAVPSTNNISASNNNNNNNQNPSKEFFS